MRKTLFLVFIHGFKGGDDTFGNFPNHLRALIQHALPNVDVVAAIYPRFETRGELRDCVARFREWLENKVIDIEVSRKTPSPTVDPTVHTILVGHSMGGVVAAETFLLLASEKPIDVASSSMNPETPNFPSNTTLNSSTSTGGTHPHPKHDAGPANFMFPHIQGIIAFDTPFLGLAPGVVASQLEGGYDMASNAYNAYNQVAEAFGWGSKSEPAVSAARTPPKAALPAPSTSADAAAAPKWQSWGRYAMFAGAAGAVAAGGAAALYSQREKISAGWNWANSHLLFVGDLAKAERLKQRVENLENACQERGAICANLYTNLGKAAEPRVVSGKKERRTFCNLPQKAKERRGGQNEGGMRWLEAVNDKAKDEITAHVGMFTPNDHPGFYAMGNTAKSLIANSIDQEWYKTSDKRVDNQDGPGEFDEWEKADADEGKDGGGIGRDWEGLDHVRGDDDDDFKMRVDDLQNQAGAGDLEESIIVDKAANGQVPSSASQEV